MSEKYPEELYKYNGMTHVIPGNLSGIERLSVIEELIKNQVKLIGGGKFKAGVDSFRGA